MNFDHRTAIKGRAKRAILVSDPGVIKVGLIFLVLSVIVSLLSSKIMGLSITPALAQRYMNYVADGNFDAALKALNRMAPEPSAFLMNTVLQLALSILSAGFVIFLLNTVRRVDACYGNLLDGFGMFGRIILLNILQYVFIVLWSMLFIIPGIIAAYKYRMALYLLIDHPEMSVMQCIRESKKMMDGHKGELFVLDFSFIVWDLLASIPYVGYIVDIWRVPFMNTCYVLYYEELRGAEPINYTAKAKQ